MIEYFFIFILLILVFVLAYLLRRSLFINRSYEVFFAATVDDLSTVVQGINSIIEKRPLYTENEDVRQLLRGIKLATEILNDYTKAREEIVRRPETRN